MSAQEDPEQSGFGISRQQKDFSDKWWTIQADSYMLYNRDFTDLSKHKQRPMLADLDPLWSGSGKISLSEIGNTSSQREKRTKLETKARKINSGVVGLRWFKSLYIPLCKNAMTKIPSIFFLLNRTTRCDLGETRFSLVQKQSLMGPSWNGMIHLGCSSLHYQKAKAHISANTNWLISYSIKLASCSLLLLTTFKRLNHIQFSKKPWFSCHPMAGAYALCALS